MLRINREINNMKHKIIIGAGVVILLGLIGYQMYRSYRHPEGTEGSIDSSQAQNDTILTPEEQQVADTKAAVSSAKQAQRYIHPTLGFSFGKPEGYTIGAIPGEAGGQTLIVQSVTPPSSPNDGFQIVITPLDAPMELTPNLIKSELPGTSVNNAKAIVLDQQGKGLMFSSNNAAFGGQSFEIWFTTATHLYQITSYASFASELQTIIGTWRFGP